MVRITFAVFALAATVLSPATAIARDPGPLDVRGRGAVRSGERAAAPRPHASRPAPVPPSRGLGYNPAALRFDDIHGPPSGGARPGERRGERRRLYEQVEDAVDRGNGRIEDEQTHQLRRLRDDRDERLGRIPRRREAERFEEEHDRRRRIEQRRERQRQAGRSADAAGRTAAQPRREATAIERTPNPAGSTMARFAAEQSALLDAARQRYQRDLGQAEADRDAQVRAAETRDAAAQARRRFDERRARLTREYQQYRQKVLGTDGRPSSR